MEFEFLEVCGDTLIILGLNEKKMTKTKVVVRKNDVKKNKNTYICNIKDVVDIFKNICSVTEEYFLTLKINNESTKFENKFITLVYEDREFRNDDAYHLADYISSKTGKHFFEFNKEKTKIYSNFIEIYDKILVIHGLNEEKLDKKKAILRKKDITNMSDPFVCTLDAFKYVYRAECSVTDEYFLVLGVGSIHIVLVYDDRDTRDEEAITLANEITVKTGKTFRSI